MTAISGMSWRAHEKVEEITAECQTMIRQTANFVVQLETKIKVLTGQIEQLEAVIARDTNELNEVSERIPKMNSDLRRLDSQASALRAQLNELYSRRTQCEDGDARGQVDEQLGAAEYRFAAGERSVLE